MNMNLDNEEKIVFDIDEIDLKELFSTLWQSKILIFAITSFFAMSSVIYALSLKDVYKSEAILTIEENTNPQFSLGGLSGLASIAGIDVMNAIDKKRLAIKTIQSRAFLKHLISFEDILPSIMAASTFNKDSNELIFDPEIYDEEKKAWIQPSKPGKQYAPSYLEAYETYLGQVSILDEGLVTISVEHISPIFAKEFLDLIIKETNEILRSKDLQESTDAIDFLLTEVTNSSLITMKDAINELVQSKLETQMMARISSEYVLKVIEPPFVPEKKSGPARAIICVSITLAGGLFAVLLVLIRHYNFR